MRIDPMSREPAWKQLAAILRARIEDGTYGKQELIPSITELAAESKLAVGTIRKAIGLLEEEGLVVAVPGRGTFVR